MKTIGLVGAVIAALLGASPASAAPGPPSAGLMDEAMQRGFLAYPEARQWCPTAVWRVESLTHSPEAAGQADLATCVVTLTPEAAAKPWPELCSIVAHEVGHLARLYFHENPLDPVHSPHAGHNMHAAAGGHPVCGPSSTEIADLEARLSNVSNQLWFLRSYVRALCRWRPRSREVRCVRRVRRRQVERVTRHKAERRELVAALDHARKFLPPGASD